MSGQLLSSKVVIVEEEPKVRGIPRLLLPSRARSASPSAAPSARPSSARRSTTSRPSSAASRPTPTSHSPRWASSRTAGAALGGPNHALLERPTPRPPPPLRAAGFPRRWRRPHAGHPARRRARPFVLHDGDVVRPRWTARPTPTRCSTARRPQWRRAARVRTRSPTAWSCSCASTTASSRPCCSRPPTSPTSPTPRPPRSPLPSTR